MKDDAIFQRHIARLKSSLSAHGHNTICDFLTEHTYMRGARFSFEGHEYQQKILEDPSQNIVILKSAQIGISEMSARLALAKAVPFFFFFFLMGSGRSTRCWQRARRRTS